MKSFALLAALAGLAVAAPQGVTSIISAPGSTPSGCSTSYSGSFEITIVKPSSKRDLAERQTSSSCGQTGILTITKLTNGLMYDNQGRQAYIAANGQFQFDAPPVQTGAVYTAGWAVCGNGSIAIGGTTLFQQCQSGSIYNLYLNNSAAQCSTVNIDIIPCSGYTGTGAAAGLTQSSDGQPAATKSATTAAPISQSSDAQPEATVSGTKVPVSQSSDAQPEATVSATKVPVSQSKDAQPEATVSATKVPVSQYTDAQPQVTVSATTAASATHTIAASSASVASIGSLVLMIAGAVAFSML